MSTVSKPAFTSFFSNLPLDVEKYLESPAVADALSNAPAPDQAEASKFPERLRAIAQDGKISSPEQAAQFFEAIDRLDHDGLAATVGSDTAVKLAEQAKQLAALQNLHDPFSTTPTTPVDTGAGQISAPVGVFQLGAGAKTMPVLSELPGTPRFHQAPRGQPLTGLKSYSQITANGQTAAQFVAKADFDSDGSPSFADSGTHQDDTSMHFRVGGRLLAINGEKVPYVVLPPEIVRKTGAKLGDLVQVSFHGSSTFAIFADGGPYGKAGEISGATARAANITDDSGRHLITGNIGRDTQDVVYTLLAGSGAQVGITNNGAPVSADDIQQKGAQAFLAAQQQGVFS